MEPSSPARASGIPPHAQDLCSRLSGRNGQTGPASGILLKGSVVATWWGICPVGVAQWVHFPVRAHACVVGSVPCGVCRRQPISDVCFPLLPL